jgi:hypothetical protein
MFSRKQPRSTDLRGPIRASKQQTSVRIDALVFPIFLTILLALTAPKCLATTSGTAESDGIAISGANLATEAGGTTPPDNGSRLARANDGSMAEESNDAPAFTASHSPSVVNDPPSGVLRSYQKTIDPALSTKCIVFHESLCRALKNRRIVFLATIQTAALVSDGVTTRQFLHRGYVEVEPVARILIGSKPTWGRMAPLGAVQVAAGMWLAERMAMSRHVWVRRFWWLPQIMGIAGNLAATGHNFALH